jgi:hypothetical protein
MTRILPLFTVLTWFFVLNTKAQQVKFTVQDAQTGEVLPGATVYQLCTKKAGITDFEGYYKLRGRKGDTCTIFISMIGYEPYYIKIRFSGDTSVNVALPLKTLEEVVITGTQNAQQKVQSAQMSVESLTIKESKTLPAIFGEVDIIKTLQLKPGVSNGGEGFSGLYVRGGGPDQNLMLLDEAIVYNPNHLLGFFSVFNSDAVKGVELYKGGFPAQYGGRLSSVVDISLREGDFNKHTVSGGIGLISSRLTAEGPIVKDKLSYILSGRRTYFDIFTRAYNRYKLAQNNPRFNPIPDYYFYDLNLKLAWRIGPKDKLTWSNYYGDDVFGFSSRNQFRVNFDWGNRMSILKWFHEYDKTLFSTTNIHYSKYDYKIRNRIDNFTFRLGSGVEDLGATHQYTFTPGNGHTIKAGITTTKHSFDIGRASLLTSDNSFSFNAGQGLSSWEGGIFLNEEFSFGPRWLFNTGLRYSNFVRDRQYFGGLEPRFSARYMLNEDISVKANYTRMFQYLHLVLNSGVSLPTDLWYPASNKVLPQISDQYAASYSISLGGGDYFFSNEFYYKNMRRQIDIKDGASFFINERLDTIFVFGKGWAYGTEFYLEKKYGKTTGWIGYTLSYTYRQFDAINRGERFFPRYDRRHDISVVVMHELNKRFTLSGTWVFGTGNAISLPEARFVFQDQPGVASPSGSLLPIINVIPIVERRNSFRMAPYHRLDIGLVYKLNPKWGESDLTLSIYNAYNRLNPFFIYFETITENPDGTGQIRGFAAKQVTLFPIIPSISYNFKF